MSKHKALSFLIIGTGDLRNYGCEAIVHGTVAILRKVYPDCSITICSDNIAYDGKLLPTGVIPIAYKKRFTPYRIFKGILRRLFHVGGGSYVHMDTKIGMRYDVVLSCGGDNYCQVPDGSIYTLLEDLMTVGENAVKAKKKFVLWGASVGPFSRSEVRERVIGNLAKANLLVVRENLSFDYLKQFSDCAGHLVCTADPAFCMKPLPYDLQRKEGKVYIGINVSVLALHHVGCESSALQSFAHRLATLHQKHPEWVFVGVPHVQIDGAQDDFNALNVIDSGINNPSIYYNLRRDLGSRLTKGAIASLDVLVAARMHCCVAGISTGVPTLFLTYSNKGIGMAKYAYGNNKYTLDFKQFDQQSFADLLEEMVGQREIIHTYLDAQHDRFVNESMEAGVQLRKVMG